jgi:hypothetical protein
MGGACSTNGEKRNIGYWWESHNEGNHLEDPRRRWVDNIKVDLKEG